MWAAHGAYLRDGFSDGGGVVAVVGVGLKDGVEVDEIHPHLVQVGELLLDALEVAAEIILRWPPTSLGCQKGSACLSA